MTVYILLFVANDWLNIVSHSLSQTQDSTNGLVAHWMNDSEMDHGADDRTDF